MTLLLDESYELHRLQATETTIQLIGAYQDPLGQVLADRNRFSQIISNLIGNSLEFTPPGGAIRLDAEMVGDVVALTLKDSGPGIASDALPHVFDRFCQSQARKDGGGLGLAIAKGIVEAHGGTISAESKLGEGATFRFTLKRADVS